MTIQNARSNTSGSAPSNLAQGQLAVNQADGALFTRTTAGGVLKTPLIALVGDTGSGGKAGYVPAPAAGDAAAGRYLKSDGSWSVPPVGAGSGVVRNVQNSNYTIAAGDAGKLILFTGTPTLSIDPTAVGSTFSCLIRNDNALAGAGQIVPASGTIDGLAKIFVYPGETFQLTGNGTDIKTVGRSRLVLLNATPSATGGYNLTDGCADTEIAEIDIRAAGLTGSASDNLLIQVNTLTTGYYSHQVRSSGTTVTSTTNNNQSNWVLENAVSASPRDFELTIKKLNTGPSFRCRLEQITGAAAVQIVSSGYLNTSNTLSQLQVYYGSASMTGGNIRAYGRR